MFSVDVGGHLFRFTGGTVVECGEGTVVNRLPSIERSQRESGQPPRHQRVQGKKAEDGFLSGHHVTSTRFIHSLRLHYITSWFHVNLRRCSTLYSVRVTFFLRVSKTTTWQLYAYL